MAYATPREWLVDPFGADGATMKPAGSATNDPVPANLPLVYPDDSDYLVSMVDLAVVRPSDVAVRVITPGCPRLALTMARARPLKALRSGEAKMLRSVGSPLSVATSTPGPVSSKWIGFLERGTIRPSLSATVRVTKERSWPSPAMMLRSGLSSNCVGRPVVLTESVAHSLPFLYATTFSSPGS